MRIQRFSARTVPEAMAAVKRSLGPDAVLLETRRIKDEARRAAGELVEVVAAVDRNPGRRRRVIPPVRPSFDRVLQGVEGNTDRRQVPAPSAVASRESSAPPVAREIRRPQGRAPEPEPPRGGGAEAAAAPATEPRLPEAVARAIARLEARIGVVAEAVQALAAAAPPEPAPEPAPPAAPEANELIAVTSALLALDRKVDALLAAAPGPAAAGGEEVAPRLLAELTVAGLDPLAARHWGERLQGSYRERPASPGETPLMRLAELLGEAITCAPQAGPGEVHALLGSSGAGKSTLVVKLALRAKELHRIAVHLITLDFARPEGSALLERYAEVFGLPLTRVADAAALAAATERLPEGALCLIDCPATGVDVERQPALMALVAGLGSRAVRHLLLPASTALPEMRRQVAAHRSLGIDCLAFTKVDEAAAFGQVAALAAETGLPVSWLSTGRQLPEDLADANPDLLRTLVTRQRGAVKPPAGAASKSPLVATCVSDKEQR